MQRRILVRASVVAIAAMTPALTTTIGANAAQPTGKAAGLHRLSIPAGLKYVPAMARNDHRQVGVIFTLKGASVGAQVADARAHGHSLSTSDRAALRKQVAQGQQSTLAHVRSAGGKVDYTYQDAYNGFAAKVPASSLGALAADPDVASVHVTHTLSLNDVSGNQYVGAPAAWNKSTPVTGTTGKGVKIAIIDTGVDYTHADFGGPGTEAAFKADDGTTLADGGFPTTKVVGGRDYVGDAYNADDPAHNVPQPDPDPLDCNGHGSHVAGIAAGEGVLSDGSTYTGPYDNTTFNHSFKVGPGIAPEASILAYRVFGCSGTVDNSIVVAALNQALVDGANVINMSLGSPFGRADDPEVATVDQLSAAGVTVVASAGNNGTNAYLVGAPAAADTAIAVAAMDATTPTVPGAHTTGGVSKPLDMQLSNDVDFTDGQTLPVKVLHNSDGSVSLGCDPSEYAGSTGDLVVVQRGTCGRVDRAIYGQQGGAAAVAMIDSTTGYPPVEGKITENPDTGAKFTVTIPFFGVKGLVGSGTSDGDALAAADGKTVTLTHTNIPNPNYGKFASFTSGGPRNGDSAVKPDVTAPGVSVLSAGVGTGSGPATISGTSQASPATAGVAALVKQAHPSWTPEQIKAAIVSTANPSLVTSGYDVRIGGTGVVQPARAVDSAVLPLTDHSRSSLTFGYHPEAGAWSQTLPFTLQNTSGSAVTYHLTSAMEDALGATVTISPTSVTVAGGQSKSVNVTMSMSKAAVAGLPPATDSNAGALDSVRGAVLATPATASKGLYQLQVPFLAVPRGLSNVTAGTPTKPVPVSPDSPIFQTKIPLANTGVHSGDADVYAWGISDPNDVPNAAEDATDVRAAGVQVFPNGSDTVDVFAVNMYGRWSNPGSEEIDVAIDNNNDGVPDHYVVGLDRGILTTGQFDGHYESFMTDASFNVIAAFDATAPMNDSVAELPAFGSLIGISAAHPSFRYAIATSSIIPGGLNDSTSWANFNAYAPSVETGAFVTIAPGHGGSLPVSFDRGKVASQKTLGWMVVTTDDANGPAQAETVAVPNAPGPKKV